MGFVISILHLNDPANHDFCEENNTLVSLPWMKEPFNTISNLAYIHNGIVYILVWMVVNKVAFRYYRLRAFVLPVQSIIVGIGSMCLHATLKRWGQILDEVPMLIIVMLMVWMNLSSLEILNCCIKSVFVFGMSIVIFVYLFIPQMYWIFLVFFFGMVLAGFILEIWICCGFHCCGGRFCRLQRINPRIRKDKPAQCYLAKLIAWSWGSFTFAFLIWIIDSSLCKYVQKAHLHVLWHFLTAYFVYLQFVFADFVYFYHNKEKWHPTPHGLTCCRCIPLLPFIVVRKVDPSHTRKDIDEDEDDEKVPLIGDDHQGEIRDMSSDIGEAVADIITFKEDGDEGGEGGGGEQQKTEEKDDDDEEEEDDEDDDDEDEDSTDDDDDDKVNEAVKDDSSDDDGDNQI